MTSSATSRPALGGIQRIKLSDNEEVERARKHLLLLLEDPHYQEAYLRLEKAKKLPEKPSGIFPNRIGAYAAKLMASQQQTNQVRPKKSSPGRPNDHLLQNPKLMLAHFERRCEPGLTLMEFCRQFLRSVFPYANSDQLEGVAKTVHRKMLDIRRRRRELNSRT